MKAVHFGAGNIGRGFIGDLLHDSGYEIVFLDVDTKMVNEINKSHSYELRLIDHDYKQKIIDKVSAVSTIDDENEAVKAIVEADLITTSVWANNLSKIASLLAKGIKARLAAGKRKINIMACENAVFATQILKKYLSDKGLTDAELDKAACYPSTAVDRVVIGENIDGKPIVNIADYNELAIEKNLADPDKVPIRGAKYTDVLEKYLKRKLYIVNCGHAWAGYVGYINGYTSARDVFLNENFVDGIRHAMQEAAKYIESEYDFSAQEMDEYVNFAIKRYQAKGVDYKISMVARSPIRKLGRNDRMVGPCLGCAKYNFPNKYLLKGIAMIFLFDYAADAEAVKLQEYIKEFGIENAVEHFTGIKKGTAMHKQILFYYKEQKEIRDKNK